MLPGDASLKPLRWPQAWLLLWWSLVGLVVTLSLIPGDTVPPLPVMGGDKLEHCAAYAALAATAVQLFTRNAVLRAGAGLVALGIGLELGQYLFTSSRQMDVFDALANALGVAAGLSTGWTPWRDLLVQRFPR